jgi:indolepyruvate ferredoxin oxidoreductase
LKTVQPGRTTAVVNLDVSPTGEFQTHKDMDFGDDGMRRALAAALGAGALFELHASRLATDLTGDSIGTNVFMLGYAAQRALLPVSIAALEQAIRLNGTFVEGNLRTFALGRLAAHAPEVLAKELKGETEPVPLATVEDVLASRTRLLERYQNGAYAARYREFITTVRGRVSALPLEGGDALVRQVALTLSRLMAYKDEYEVARLYADPLFSQRLREQFTGHSKLTLHLAPPMLPGRDADGRPRKRTFGAWMLPLFKLLAPLKTVRGTPFDPFGYTAERRMERALIDEYRQLIERIVAQLNPGNLAAAIELAAAAGQIAGYGPVKDAAVATYRVRLEGLLKAFEARPADPG